MEIFFFLEGGLNYRIQIVNKFVNFITVGFRFFLGGLVVGFEGSMHPPITAYEALDVYVYF